MTAVSPLRVPVLMYHEIADVAATQDPFAVSPDVFAEQLAYLRDAGFNPVTAGALSAILANGASDLPERPVVLTFDDGYGDFYTRAMPLLQQHGFTRLQNVMGGMSAFSETKCPGLAPPELVAHRD